MSLMILLGDVSITDMLNNTVKCGYIRKVELDELAKYINMDFLDGKLYHFRDNASGDEVDSILEFANGEYAAVEIKLTSKGIEDGIASLKTFYDNVKRKNLNLCV